MTAPPDNHAPGRPGGAASHPYRAEDASWTLAPELARGLRWYRSRARRVQLLNLAILAVGLAAGAAVARVHWIGWLMFGVVGLYVGFWVVISTVVLRSTVRCCDQLGREPGRLAWLHLDTEPASGTLRRCELRTRDGEAWAVFVPAALAAALAEAAIGWPFQVTRTQAARAAYLPVHEAELRLRRYPTC